MPKEHGTKQDTATSLNISETYSKQEPRRPTKTLHQLVTLHSNDDTIFAFWNDVVDSEAKATLALPNSSVKYIGEWLPGQICIVKNQMVIDNVQRELQESFYIKHRAAATGDATFGTIYQVDSINHRM